MTDDASTQHSNDDSQVIQRASAPKNLHAPKVEDEITFSSEAAAVDNGSQPSESRTNNECAVNSTQTVSQRVGAVLRSLSQVSPSGILQFVRNVSMSR
jgi:hypothetical protein